jgi:MFS family permease
MIIAVALLGVGAGAEADLLGFLVSRYYGMRAFGQIYGWVFAAFLVGSAIGPYLLGAAFDILGSYGLALYLCAAALIVVIALLLLLPRFPSFAANEDD